MVRLGKVMDRLDVLLGRVETWVIAILSLVALGLGTMQVILRYVFNTGFEWNEAVFILVTVTAMLMAGVRGVRDDAHVRVDILVTILPTVVTRYVDGIAMLASLALCAFYVWCGFAFVGFLRMMGTVSVETHIPDWITFSIMPVMMSLFSIRYVLRLRDLLQGQEVSHEQSSDGGGV